MTLAVHSRSSLVPRAAATAAQAFMGVGAVFGGYNLIADAEAFGMDRKWLEHSPFEDYLIPGWFLLLAIGLGNLLGAGLALLGNRWWPVAALANGLVMVAWLTIETAIVRWQGGPQGALLVLCGGSAIVMLAAGTRAGGLTTVRGLIGR